LCYLSCPDLIPKTWCPSPFCHPSSEKDSRPFIRPSLYPPLAYDAANSSHFADGSGEIVPLCDSQDWAWNFLHPKFNRPIAVDGKVIVPTYDGRVFVLGLA